MTPREARRERRAAERKPKKAEMRRNNAGSTSKDFAPAATAAAAAAPAAPEVDFATHEPATHHEAAAREDVTLNDWLAAARRRNYPNGLPAAPPASNLEFIAETIPTGSRRAEINRAKINRANAQFSSGPRTSAGKLASSRNSTKHGLASSQPIIPGENAAAFEELLADLTRDHNPASRTEELLVRQMAQSYWLEQRAIRLQNGCFTDIGVDRQGLALYMRYATTHNRAFHKALADLRRLQKEREKQQRGFVSQTRSKSTPPDGFVRQIDPNEPPTDIKPGFFSQPQLTEPLERSHNISQAA